MLSEKGLSDFRAYGVSGDEALAPMLLYWIFRTKIAAAVYAFNYLMAHNSEIFSMGEQVETSQNQ